MAKFHPKARGFEEYFGHIGGSHDYFTSKVGGKGATYALEGWDGKPFEFSDDYLTDVNARAACDFIGRADKSRPWFLYVAFNAPHGPTQATQKYLDRSPHIADPPRRTHAAMVSALDDAVGAILAQLRKDGAAEVAPESGRASLRPRRLRDLCVFQIRNEPRRTKVSKPVTDRVAPDRGVGYLCASPSLPHLMGKEFNITPRDVPHVESRYRRIATPIPHPDSVATLEKLRELEPQSMRGQPPIVWERAEDVFIYDKYGNRWLDWSSGVLVTNAGHGAPEVKQAIIDQVNSGLIHNYCFPSEERAELASLLASVAPEGLKKVFLLTTGSEATECAIKLSRAHGIKVGGKEKIGIIGWERGFHGRTLGSQQAGGMSGQKSWIVNEDPAIITAPFPDGYWQEDTSFETFLAAVKARGMKPENVAGVIMETYQGVGPDFAPVEFVHQLRAWCDQHQIALTFDEVQAGFGRTGKFWAFEHYGVTPDLICCGKGISSSLPLSAVIGRAAVMDQFGPGSMTSTHTGNPVCCAAAMASVKKILREKMTENAAALEPLLLEGLRAIQAKHREVIGHVTARGLVGGMQTVVRGKKEPHHDLAHAIIERCMWKGLLLFSPVGAWGQTVKIAPPLTITREAMAEGIAVLAEATDEAVAAL